MSKDISASSTSDPERDANLRLGQRLRRARLNMNLTQGEVAKNLFSISYISGVERGQIRPSLGALEKLAERLRVQVAEIVADDALEIRHYTLPHRESAAARQRDEIEAGLREAQILYREHNSATAIELLLRLQSQNLTPRESATLSLYLARCFLDLGHSEEARSIAQEAIPLAERAGERELAERIRLEHANAFAQMHDHVAALELYQECLSAVRQHHPCDPTFMLDIQLHIGSLEAATGDYDKAIATLLEATEVSDDVIQPEALGSTYWTISRTLKNHGDHAGAQSYARRSIAAYDEAVYRRSVAAVYNRLGTALARTHQVSKALSQFTRLHAFSEGWHDLRGIAEAEQNLALVYLEEKRNAEANQAASEAVTAAERVGDVILQAGSLLVQARVQESHKRFADATGSFERAIELLQSLQYSTATDQLREAYAQFSEYLERRGESNRAFDMLKQAYKST
jgi:tetratricopeptide (TPR) repeat protein